MRTLIRYLNENIGKSANVSGYVENVREFKEFNFVFLRDRTGTCQTVVPKSIVPERIGNECIATIQGDVLENPKSKHNGIELLAKKIEILSRGIPGKAFDTKFSEIGLENKLNMRPASIKLEETRKIFELESALVGAFRNYLDSNEFVDVRTPKIISTMNESGANLFEIDYFGKKAFLAQSPVLYHQMLLASFERVYEIGPCFRAQKYHTQRHANEFSTLDAEIAFTYTNEEVMSLLEDMLNQTLPCITDVMVEKIPRIVYSDAIKLLGKSEGQKISGSDKNKIGEIFREKSKSDFLFLHSFPLSLCQFFTQPENESHGQNFSLLYKGLEICSGGQRIHDTELLKQSMATRGIDPVHFSDYMSAFNLGIPPHGGFSIGIPRLNSILNGVVNVKEAILFPRDPNRITP